MLRYQPTNSPGRLSRVIFPEASQNEPPKTDQPVAGVGVLTLCLVRADFSFRGGGAEGVGDVHILFIVYPWYVCLSGVLCTVLGVFRMYTRRIVKSLCSFGLLAAYLICPPPDFVFRDVFVTGMSMQTFRVGSLFHVDVEDALA